MAPLILMKPLLPVYEIEANVRLGVWVIVGASEHDGVLVTENGIEKGTKSIPSWKT